VRVTCAQITRLLPTPMTRADWNLFWPIGQLVESAPVP
jgi:hypothetical protein